MKERNVVENQKDGILLSHSLCFDEDDRHDGNTLLINTCSATREKQQDPEKIPNDNLRNQQRNILQLVHMYCLQLT